MPAPSPFAAATWPQLSRLFDEALDLPPQEREAWLERLHREQPELAPDLRALLSAQARRETADFLERGPAFETALDDDEAGPALAAGDALGPYRLLRPLGSGGMAVVWLAERSDAALGRQVAIKLPQRFLWRPGLAERFARERDILARLEHPHIARLYDAGIGSGDGPAAELPYLVLEYVQGTTLIEYCDAHRLGIRGRLALALQVLDAVQYAHTRLVIHRDLKPANILVTADGEVRLLDFGIAKLLVGDGAEGRQTQLTQRAGRVLTPDYASPEQVCGEALGTTSDVYSMGVVLCELLSGKRPYRLAVDTPAQLEQAILSAEPELPSRLVDAAAAASRDATAPRLSRALAGDLDTIVAKALAKLPAERYATAAALADDLRRYLGGEAVRARPRSRAYRLRKFVVRNRVVVGAVSAVLVAVLAAGGVALRQAQLARAEAERADEVKRFVLSIFQAAETGAGASRQTSAVELLSQARQRLDGATTIEPATRVELLTAIGFSTLLLGDTAQAAPVLEEALALAERHLPEHDSRRAAAEVAVARVLWARGNPAQARRLLDRAEETVRAAGDRRELVNVLRWQATIALAQARTADAVAIASRAVQVAEALPPKDRPRALQSATYAYANVLGVARHPDHLAAARRAVAVAEEVHGKKPGSVIFGVRSELAQALMTQPDFAGAAAELTAVAEGQIILLGPRHIELGLTLLRLGLARQRVGDLAGARAALEQSREIYALHADGKPTRDRVIVQAAVGAVALSARRLADAEREYERAIEMGQQVLDARHTELFVSRAQLADLYTRTGRLEAADRLFAALMARLPVSPVSDAGFRLRVGLLRSAQGRHDEAEIELAAAVVGLGKEPRAALDHGRALAALGAARVAAGRPRDAIEPLEAGLALIVRHQPQATPDRADALLAKARAKSALGDHEAAIAAAQQAATFWQRYDSTQADAARARDILAAVRAAAQRS